MFWDVGNYFMYKLNEFQPSYQAVEVEQSLTAGRSNSGRGKIFLFSPNRPDGARGSTCLLFTGPRCPSPVVKRPGCEVDHSHPPSAVVKNEWS